MYSSQAGLNLDTGTGEVFLHKVHIFHFEGLAVQVGKGTGIGGEVEGQLIGVQGLIVPVEALVQLAVFTVTQEGMARVGELGTDLVGPSGDQLAFHQCQTIPGSDGLVVGLAGLAACLGGIGDEDPVFLGILE